MIRLFCHLHGMCQVSWLMKIINLLTKVPIDVPHSFGHMLPMSNHHHMQERRRWREYLNDYCDVREKIQTFNDVICQTYVLLENRVRSLVDKKLINAHFS